MEERRHITKEDEIQTKDIATLKTDVAKHGETLVSINDTLTRIEEKQNEMNKCFEPINETFKATALMGKWLMTFLVFLSILGGVIVAWCKILHK